MYINIRKIFLSLMYDSNELIVQQQEYLCSEC
jgi:hypothetical protein